MKKIMAHCLSSLFLLFTISILSCSTPGSAVGTKGASAVPVIFETDMGNDVDDALALDMLYKYMDEGKVKLMGISNNKNSDYSLPFLQIMNNKYGYPKIPLGNVLQGANSKGDSRDYAQAVCEYSEGGEPVFEKFKKKNAETVESVMLYRRLLSQQPDTSVIIISVGFSTNIARLLDSEPDNYSSYNGRELIKKKVKFLSMMAGSFNDALKGGEYNVIKDTAAAQKVFREWPTSIIVSPFEVGASILYPAASIENDFKWGEPHPLTIAYRSYLPMPYNRPTWDLTAVLYAIEGKADYFAISEPGEIAVHSKGKTLFVPSSTGKSRYLMVNTQQAERIKNRFIELITRKPKYYQYKN